MTTLNYETKAGSLNHQEPMVPHPVAIKAIKRETGDTATYAFSFVDPEIRLNYRFDAGQFNMLYLPGIGEVAISISSDPGTPGTLLHTIREAGNVTRALARRRPGDVIGLRGPFGSGWPLDAAAGQDLIIVTGGIGLAPLRPAIYEVIRRRSSYGKVTILCGSRTPSDLLYTGEYDRWRSHDIDVIVTVDRADASWTGHVGVVPMMFYSLRPDPRRTVVFSCGPEIMMRFVVYEALARRIAKERIYLSLERNMKCAIGFCGHCQYGPAFLCKDGPVLSYQRIEPFFGVEEY